MNSAQNISNSAMLISYSFFFLAIILTRLQKVRLSKDLFVSTLRMSIQLVLVGYALQFVFKFDQWFLIVIIFLFMVFFAAQTIYARVGIKLRGFFLLSFYSILASATTIMLVFTFFVITIDPWYEPRYFIPLVGMVIGNSMNGTALALERFFDDLRQNMKKVETMLALGATSKAASLPSLQKAYKASILPTISSMSGMGIVFLPGMMTGQIIGGSDPLLAIKYQIAIMLAILGAVTMSCFLILHLERKKLFDAYHLPIAELFADDHDH